MVKKQFAIGVDVGGTFTDLIGVDELGNVKATKTLSTSPDPAIGVVNAVDKMAGVLHMTSDELIHNTIRFVYGTTVATNALLERKGLNVALITTKGFKDNLNIRRMWRENTFDLRSIPPTPIVPRDRIYEVTERIDVDGKILQLLVEEEVESIAENLEKAHVESVAVCLLFSFLNPAHEKRIKEILNKKVPNIKVSLSSVVCPEIREYERASTVVMNAYLASSVGKHLENLEGELKKKGGKFGLEIMQSNGGATTTSFIADRPANIFLSGPAGGVVGTSFLGQMIKGEAGNNFLAVDMGGTSYDICLLPEGRILLSRIKLFHGWHIVTPTIDIHTIGAGGGSIAWLDIAGGLHVGPQSAGALPGPACYMRGGEEPTVSDADLLLGYLNPNYFLGGEMKLSIEKAEKAIKKISNRLGLSPLETADGIFRIINNNMLVGKRFVTIERGYDPRDFTLVVFGGAGAVHVPAIAPELGIKHIIIPRDASGFSAVGLVVSDIRYDFVKNLNTSTGETSLNELLNEYEYLKKEGKSLLDASDTKPEDMYFELGADMKFPGEYQEFPIDLPSKLNSVEEVAQAFKNRHSQLYGYVEEAPPQIVNIRLSAFGRTIKPKITKAELGGENCGGAVKAKRDAFFYEEGKLILTPIYDGQRIIPGNKLHGPAIIELPTTTIVARPGQTVFMDEFFNFNIQC